MSTSTLGRTERRKLERNALKQQRKSRASAAIPQGRASRYPTAIMVMLIIVAASLAAIASPSVKSWFKRSHPPILLYTAPNQTTIHLDDGGIAYATDNRISAFHGHDPRHYQLIGLQYTVGSVDDTDYHPLLWRSIEMSLEKPDGSVAEVSASRPLWWFEVTKAKEGATVPLDMEEAGISGMATVRKITSLSNEPYKPSKPGYQPVIGTIKHLNASVVELTFEGAEDEPLGVTPNHPLWSEDRHEWVSAGELRIGELVTTADASARLLRSEQKPGKHTVYNLEVHRSHSYHVGKLGLMAHNTGLECERIFSVYDQFLKRSNGELWVAYESLLRRVPNLGEHLEMRAKTFADVLDRHLKQSPGTYSLAVLRQKLLPSGVPVGVSGTSADIREISGSAIDAEKFLRDISSGCTKVDKAGYEGVAVEAPGGGFLGARYHMAKSPQTAITIDVNIPGVPEIKKIKFNP